jgi:hypothetical protein
LDKKNTTEAKKGVKTAKGVKDLPTSQRQSS